MRTPEEKVEALRGLHWSRGVFVIPDADDSESATILERAGFRAIAVVRSRIHAALTASNGRDASRDEILEAIRCIATSVDVPVIAEMDTGYRGSPDHLRAAGSGSQRGDDLGSAQTPHRLGLPGIVVGACRPGVGRSGVPGVRGRCGPPSPASVS